MSKIGPDDRSSTAKAMSKVSEIMAICMMMVVPAAIGIWIDQKLSTFLLFTILGLLFGVFASVVQLIKLVSPENEDEGP